MNAETSNRVLVDHVNKSPLDLDPAREYECVIERGSYAADLRTAGYGYGMSRDQVAAWTGTAGLKNTLEIVTRTGAQIEAAAENANNSVFVEFDDTFWLVEMRDGGSR